MSVDCSDIHFVSKWTLNACTNAASTEFSTVLGRVQRFLGDPEMKIDFLLGCCALLHLTFCNLSTEFRFQVVLRNSKHRHHTTDALFEEIPWMPITKIIKITLTKPVVLNLYEDFNGFIPRIWT